MPYCEDYIELISAAVDGELSPLEREKLEAHFAQCPDCWALMNDLTAIHAALSPTVAAPLMEAPAGLKEDILSAVNASKVTALPVKKNFYYKKWLASAAALALVMAGAWGWYASRPGSSDTMPAAGMGMEATPAETALADDVDLTGNAQPAEAGVPAPVSAVAPQSSAPESSSDTPPSYGMAKAATGKQTDEAQAAQPAPQSEEAPSVQSRMADISLPIEGEDDSQEPILTVAPRFFSAPLPPSAENGTDTDNTPDAQPTPEVCSLPLLSSAPTECWEEAPEETWMVPVATAQEAVKVLADYIYEFVEAVEPALEQEEPLTWYLSSPTGVSGTAALSEETETVFRFTYTDSEGGKPLDYAIAKADGAVTFLGESVQP